MLSAIVIFALIGLFIIASFYRKNEAEQRQVEKLRSRWGKPKDEYFDFDRIKRYAHVIEDEPFHRLSEQTKNDIDFYKLFEFIDRTTSKVGQQFLYKQLTELTNDSKELLEFNEKVKLLSEDQSLREKIQTVLLKLKSNDAYFITSLLKEDLLQKPRWYLFSLLSTTTVVSMFALSPIYPVLLIVLIIPITCNMVLHLWNKGNVLQFVKSLPQLNVLIEVAKETSQIYQASANVLIGESIVELRPFQRRLILLGSAATGGLRDELSQIVMYFVELLKAVFLVELHVIFLITNELKNKKKNIKSLFEYIGQLDAIISVGSLRSGNLLTCQPAFTTSAKSFKIQNAFHPLIENCVLNSLEAKRKSILITGSNMSGKTTFLRTLAINSILAQTICTCFAETFETPIFRQFSSIRIEDNLFEGKSLYFEEVTVMASLVEQVNSGFQNLFILDEVFKGTNTVERIASNKAILSYLNRRENIVIVSTHDIELADLLKDEFDLYHFAEKIENEKLSFDHTIKPGPLTTRNAITILELSGFPKEITDEARNLTS